MRLIFALFCVFSFLPVAAAHAQQPQAKAAVAADDSSNEASVVFLPWTQSLRGAVKNLSVEKAEKTHVFTMKQSVVDALRRSGAFTTFGIDVADSLRHINFKPKSGKVDETTELRLGLKTAKASDSKTVCQTGTCWGSYTLKGDKSGKLSVASSESIMAPHTALKQLKDTPLSVCLAVSASSPGTISVDKLTVKYTQPVERCDKPKFTIAGYWKSSYECLDACDGPQGRKELQIYITQDPEDLTKATYVDTEGGEFKGRFCGNEFVFEGGGSDWSESGVLVFDTANTAAKASQYSINDKCCGGSCSDTLVRIAAPQTAQAQAE